MEAISAEGGFAYGEKRMKIMFCYQCEQKPFAILLTLLYYTVKGIYIGPHEPAFILGNVFDTLQEKFGLKSINSPEEGLKIRVKKWDMISLSQRHG